jgi:K+-sensing histidine kinase KdpD
MNTNGIGLGLVIANKIVKQFNGKMSFSSKEGLGSIFAFNMKLGSSEKEIAI